MDINMLTFRLTIKQWNAYFCCALPWIISLTESVFCNTPTWHSSLRLSTVLNFKLFVFIWNRCIIWQVSKTIIFASWIMGLYCLLHQLLILKPILSTWFDCWFVFLLNPYQVNVESPLYYVKCGLTKMSSNLQNITWKTEISKTIHQKVSFSLPTSFSEGQRLNP